MDLQGAGGRRCELEASAWDVGSSGAATPEPMGLSVVILLGWPRRVRVIVVGTFRPEAWLEICARPGRLLANLARPPLVSSWWMAVGFPPGVAPKEDRVVATGMVRTMVLVPVVMAPRFCMGVGSFTLVA